MPTWRERAAPARRRTAASRRRRRPPAPARRREGDLLALSGVSAGYRGVPVVQDVSLGVAAGEISLVVGPNGAGKSTLVKTAIGELAPLGGRIIFDGEDVSGWSEERRSVAGLGYVPQVRDVFPTLTVVENLEVGAYRMRSRDAKAAVGRDARALPCSSSGFVIARRGNSAAASASCSPSRAA